MALGFLAAGEERTRVRRDRTGAFTAVTVAAADAQKNATAAAACDTVMRRERLRAKGTGEARSQRGAGSRAGLPLIGMSRERVINSRSTVAAAAFAPQWNGWVLSEWADALSARRRRVSSMERMHGRGR